MVTHMALTDTATGGAEVPLDTFRVRIAVIRAAKGWNYSQAGNTCGVGVENWRKWEKTDRRPQDYEEVCRKIADATGFDRAWIASGGPLRSRCVYGVDNPPDQQLKLRLETYTSPVGVERRIAS